MSLVHMLNTPLSLCERKLQAAIFFKYIFITACAGQYLNMIWNSLYINGETGSLSKKFYTPHLQQISKHSLAVQVTTDLSPLAK